MRAFCVRVRRGVRFYAKEMAHGAKGEGREEKDEGGDVQMVCLDALGAAVNGHVAGLLHDHGEEELERLRCDERVSTSTAYGVHRGTRSRMHKGDKTKTHR